MKVVEQVPVRERVGLAVVEGVPVRGLRDVEPDRDTDVPDSDHVGGLAVGEPLAVWVGV